MKTDDTDKLRHLLIPLFFVIPLLFSGCGTLGSSATDLALIGTGGVIGYEASGKKIGGAAIGAAGGYVASKIIQNELTRQLNDAEKYGYDRAMNQAVKQQYWIIQNQQRRDERTDDTDTRFVTVTLPETVTDGGTVLNPATATLRTH